MLGKDKGTGAHLRARKRQRRGQNRLLKILRDITLFCGSRHLSRSASVTEAALVEGVAPFPGCRGGKAGERKEKRDAAVISGPNAGRYLIFPPPSPKSCGLPESGLVERCGTESLWDGKAARGHIVVTPQRKRGEFGCEAAVRASFFGDEVLCTNFSPIRCAHRACADIHIFRNC
ncbi:hypothetical protein L345_09166, partial [Ophiophagus hannah]